MSALGELTALDWAGCIAAGVAVGFAFSVMVRALSDGGRW